MDWVHFRLFGIGNYSTLINCLTLSYFAKGIGVALDDAPDIGFSYLGRRLLRWHPSIAYLSNQTEQPTQNNE